MSILTILVGAMSSAVLIASHALPDENDLFEQQAKATAAAQQIGRDLALATSFIVLDQDTASFTVPDRGHGAAGPETIRYDWSGTPGTPLTHRYNGSTDTNLCENVHDFSLKVTHAILPLTRAPRVLLVVVNPASLSAQESSRQTAMQSWGFSVQPLAGAVTAAALASAVQHADVVYAPKDSPASLAPLLKSLSVGVVTEEITLIEGVGLAQMANWYWESTLSGIDNSHEITRTLAAGTLPILTTADYLLCLQQNPAPGGRVLGGVSTYAALLAVDVGGGLNGGGTATGRRVAMPWGDRTFDFTNVNASGLEIMRRAIVWASAPAVVSSVEVTVQVGPNASGRVTAGVQLLNSPEVP